MPREISLGGVLLPGIVVLFVLAVVLLWLLDGLMARSGFYRWVWHPPLFRVAVFVGVFGLLTFFLF